MRATAACLCYSLLLASSRGAPPAPSPPAPWLDASLPVDARVALLLSQMTNAEKAGQTVHPTDGSPAELLKTYGAAGFGAFPLASLGAPSLRATIDARNALQAAVMNASRLHIPLTFHAESLHGACAGCSIFPMPAAQGASFDADLVRDIAATVAAEAYALGVDRGFSPELNVPTDPRFGRTEENFSEDPCVVGVLGAAAARGLHGGNEGGPSSPLPPYAITSEAKHAAAYAFGGKDGAGADVSERTLYDVYLRPWREYAAAGGRGAMLAHNTINQEACHASATLMGWLRAQGAMNGSLLASDDCDVGLLRSFGLVDTLPGAAALAMGAGLDQELCAAGDGRGQAFVFAADAVASGALVQAALDRAAGNVLRSKFAAGLFDGRAMTGYDDLPRVLTPAAVALARRAAAESMVLLKNTGVLPLAYSAAAPLTIAVVGPNAGCADNATACDATRSQCGGYTNGGAPVTTVLAAAFAEAGVRVVFAAGCAIGGNDTSGFAGALAAARAASVVLFVGGDSGGLGWNKNTCGEDDDRADLDLPGVQADLVAALAATGTPVVLALVHGRPVTSTRADAFGAAAAVVAAWRPGAEGGGALWDVLSGRAPPSGRLAQAWLRTVGQVRSQAAPTLRLRQGDFDGSPYVGDANALGIAPGDARISDAPAFTFGAGLAYTTFSLALANVTNAPAGVTAAVRVVNTGAVHTSKTVVFVYYSRASPSSFVRHHARLLAFAKTPALAPGEGADLAIFAPAAALALWDPATRAYAVEPGVYTVRVGFDADNLPASANITV